MNLLFFCPLWGHRHVPFAEFVRQVAEAGYVGIEMNLPLDADEKRRVVRTLRQHEMQFIGQHFETLDTDFARHKTQFGQYLENLLAGEPRLINSHTGRDLFSVAQNTELIGLADDFAQIHGIPVVHETHRGSFAFAPHVTHPFLEQLPELRLTLDVSHWYCVAESYLDDQPEALVLAIDRTDHIHARIGHTQGTQVTDPRSPEWTRAVEKHLDCWQRVADVHQASGKQALTITTEFGAVPYLALVPFTQQPIVSQWALNGWMKEYLEQNIRLTN